MNVYKAVNDWHRFLFQLKDITQQQIEAEQRLQGKLNDLFTDVFDGVLDELEDRDRIDLNRERQMIEEHFNEIEEDYYEVLKDESLKAGQLGRNRIIHHLQALGMSIEYDDLSENIVEILDNQAFEASQYTLERMVGDVYETISEGVSEGLGTREIAESLDSQFENMEDYELRRIARTEVNNYSNLSAVETEREFGVEYHQWITAEDERVRGNEPDDIADHTVLHLQIVRIGDEFENGLEYPGDRNGSLEEFINCRCRVVPFIMPEGKTAPPNMDYFYEDDLVDVA